MFTKTIRGTRAEITEQLKSLALPHTLRGADAVKDYAIAQVPMLNSVPYQLVLSVHSINNTAMSTVAGHVTVVVSEEMTPQQTR